MPDTLNTLPTVYLTHRSQQWDYSDLNRFGHVRHLATRSIYPDEAESRPRDHLAHISDMMGDYQPALDFLALSGDPALIAMATAVAVCRAVESGAPLVRLLKWDNLERAYYPVVINLMEIGGYGEILARG